MSAAEKSRLFYQELHKIVLLVILYSFQGLPIGFFLSTIPILFKKDLTYSEVGIIMSCSLPYSIKVFWSPFVEFHSLPNFGKRKSWVIPTTLTLCALLYYMQSNLEQMLIT